MFSFDSERLKFRSLKAKDKEFYCQLYNDKDIMTFIAPPLGQKQAEKAFYSALKLTQSKNSHYFIWLVKDKVTDSSVGIAALISDKPKRIFIDAQQVEIGIMLMSKAQNSGYGQEILRALISKFYSEGFSAKIIGLPVIGNLRSIQILKNVGFRQNLEYQASSDRFEYFLLQEFMSS